MENSETKITEANVTGGVAPSEPCGDSVPVSDQQPAPGPDWELGKLIGSGARRSTWRWSFLPGGRTVVETNANIEIPAAMFRAIAERHIAEAKADFAHAEKIEFDCRQRGTDTVQQAELCGVLADMHRKEGGAIVRHWEKMLGLLKDAAQPRRAAHRVDFDAARAVPIDEMVDVRMGGFARCVWHTEKTPSMKVYEDNHVHCFGCGGHGSAVDVAMAKWGVGPREAAERLNRGER